MKACVGVAKTLTWNCFHPHCLRHSIPMLRWIHLILRQFHHAQHRIRHHQYEDAAAAEEES